MAYNIDGTSLRHTSRFVNTLACDGRTDKRTDNLPKHVPRSLSVAALHALRFKYLFNVT